MFVLCLEGQGDSAVTICTGTASCLVAKCVHSMIVGISCCKSLNQVGENTPVRLEMALICPVPIDQDSISSPASFHLILVDLVLCSLCIHNSHLSQA